MSIVNQLTKGTGKFGPLLCFTCCHIYVDHTFFESDPSLPGPNCLVFLTNTHRAREKLSL